VTGVIYVAPPSRTKGASPLSAAIESLTANMRKLPASHKRLVAEENFAGIEKSIRALEKELADAIGRAAKEVAPRKAKSK
jgi:hypothetical protein